MAIRNASSGDRITFTRGVYREATIVVNKSLVLVGEAGAVLDGTRATDILRIEADDVTVQGLTFQNVAPSHVEDRAAISVGAVKDCRVADNHIHNAFFGIYLAKTERCVILDNQLIGSGRTEDGSGDGIHLWTTRDIQILDNRIRGHRDGIYLEFSHGAQVTRNVSEQNLRYGLHFMYSDDCRYEQNAFVRNAAGVAVMYTQRVTMAGNRFEGSWGSAAYGLLLKEIYDARLERNVFSGNTTALVADGATRLDATSNTFSNNGWAIRLMASTENASFTGNSFSGNTFDVATNNRLTSNRFRGNFWDAYRGYDLNRDGIGDVAHHPVRLFSLIVESNQPTLVLLRSLVVALLDGAERVLPSLTPELLVDSMPRMRRSVQ